MRVNVGNTRKSCIFWWIMEYEEFLLRLKTARKQKKLSVREVAEKLELSPSMLTKLEQGSTPLRVKDYFHLCRLYEINPQDLFYQAYGLEMQYITKKIERLSNREFKIIKDLLMLMSLEDEEL